MNFDEEALLGTPEDLVRPYNEVFKQAFKVQKEIYERSIMAPYSDKPKIPKIIHYYWMGTEPLPELYKNAHMK